MIFSAERIIYEYECFTKLYRESPPEKLICIEFFMRVSLKFSKIFTVSNMMKYLTVVVVDFIA